MKKLVTIMGIMVLASAIVFPALAQTGTRNPGAGQGSGFGGCPWYGAGNSTLTAEQRTELDRLHQSFRNDTAGLRSELQTKREQLNDVMQSSNPDSEKARTLRQEISVLGAQVDQKHLEFQLEARKIAPDAYFGCGYGYGHGRGDGSGHHMMGHGHGSGSCWN
jgi:zinc resistance-associated protein